MSYQLVGNHPAIQKIRELIGLVSDTALSVLLLGETGTGKEVVARLLHACSPRRDKRLIKVNCGALPLSLLESELFGYEKGAFTRADKFKPGKFELASEGVIFLDQIGDMPLLLQAKLLEVLQSGEFARLGGTEVVKVNAWVIASTNHNLEQDIKEGRFREDLYYRLNVIKVELPPLRDRKEDIPLLTDYFVEKYRNEFASGNHFQLGMPIRELFSAYHWPGNVRELSSTIIRLMMGDEPEEVRAELVGNMIADRVSLPEVVTVAEEERNIGEQAKRAVTSLKAVKLNAARDIEKKAIVNALDLARWNKKVAAKILKISYKSLFNKMHSHGISIKRSS